MPLRLYMDENVSRPITVALRRQEVDVLTVQTDGLTSTSDPQVLARATELGRVLFTQDDDFLVHGAECQRTGQHFAGIIYAHQTRVTIGQSIKDLLLMAQVMDPSQMENRIEHLPLR